jgi:ribosomal protein S16
VREVREKRIVWDVERVRYWLGVGAQPTESVVKLLERVSRCSLLGVGIGGLRETTDVGL